MTAATGAPVDLIHVANRLNNDDWTEERDWEDPFHRPPSRAMPAQLSAIHLAGSVPYVAFSHPDIVGFNAGAHDANFTGWLHTISGWLKEDPSRRLLIVPFPDANSGGVRYLSSPRVFREAYAKVHDAVRGHGIGPEQVRFVFQLSAESAEGEGSEVAAYAPDGASIDLAAISWLNHGTSTAWDGWDTLYADRVAEVSEALGPQVPVLLASVASKPFHVLGDRDRWLADLAAGIGATPNAVGVVYLDRERDGVAYGVQSATDPDPAFVEFASRIGSAGDRLNWVFDGSMDEWKEETIAALPSSVFIDDDGSPFEEEMVWLARSGITNGCNPPLNDQFCPDEKVTRGQTAAFLHRALGDLLAEDDERDFTDTAGSPYAADIAWLAATGIATGCNPPANDRFCPNADMTRGDMAAYLRLALGSLEP
jgi:hypothetical protein